MEYWKKWVTDKFQLKYMLIVDASTDLSTDWKA